MGLNVSKCIQGQKKKKNQQQKHFPQSRVDYIDQMMSYCLVKNHVTHCRLKK